MRSRALALLGGLLLLLPASAIAQSAGDEQYSDPFAGKAPAKKSPANPPSSSSPSQSVPSSTPQLASPGQLASSSSPGASSDGSSSSGTLPRTGLETWVLAAMGGLMLLGGVLLRLGLRPPSKRAAGAAPATLGRDVRLTRRRH